MTRRILTGAAHDANGARVCPLQCNGETKCKAAKSKTDGPGQSVWTAPLPGACAMFYNAVTKEPT